jgi:hypothetical protein
MAQFALLLADERSRAWRLFPIPEHGHSHINSISTGDGKIIVWLLERCTAGAQDRDAR